MVCDGDWIPHVIPRDPQTGNLGKAEGEKLKAKSLPILYSVSHYLQDGLLSFADSRKV
jgi:hypothetical protein